jgi:hypothetical protein
VNKTKKELPPTPTDFHSCIHRTVLTKVNKQHHCLSKYLKKVNLVSSSTMDESACYSSLRINQYGGIYHDGVAFSVVDKHRICAVYEKLQREHGTVSSRVLAKEAGCGRTIANRIIKERKNAALAAECMVQIAAECTGHVAAASILLQLSKDDQDRCINTSYTRTIHCIPMIGQDFIKRDQKLIQEIVNKGKLPRIDWEQVKEDHNAALSNILQRKCQILFLDVSQHVMEFTPNPIDIDLLMEEGKFDGCVIHCKEMVLVATFVEQICCEIALLAQEKTGLSYEFSNHMLSALRHVANKDAMQAKEKIVYTANFGATCRPQLSMARSKNKSVRATIAAIGADRGGEFQSPKLKHSLCGPVQTLYTTKFLPVFSLSNLPAEDSWYGQRQNGKGKRSPRFRSTTNIHKRIRVKAFHPMKTSLPVNRDHLSVLASRRESDVRSMSEWIMCNYFYALPYGTTPWISANQMDEACKYADTILNKKLPFQSLCRPFPKGATGMQLSKELHDDGNAAIIPGLWTSVVGDPNVTLRFRGYGLDHYFAASNLRFCWFYGWVPHKTEYLDVLNPKKQTHSMETFHRLHHSAFSKPEIEHLSLVLFSKKHMESVVKTYTESTKRRKIKHN